MAMEYVKPIVALFPLILNPLKTVIKHVVYPFKVGSNIRSLESATEDLRALKEDVKREITNAARENDEPTYQVKLWLDQVESIEQKIVEVGENYRKLYRCIWNISPNLWSTYKISRNAAKKYVEVKNLLDKKDKIQVIVSMPQLLAQEVPAASSKLSSLELAFHYIKDDEHNIIGIWGMGGVGKTHLLKQLNNELCKDGSFNVVVFVTCSKECSEEKIQDEILDRLNLSKSNNLEQKKITIYNFLKQHNFVLLLDDLWGRVDLDTIGIPNPIDRVGTCKRKVVLTTRSTEVCGQMEVRKKIKVEVLNWDDAWSLFKEKVTEETINSDPLIQRCAVVVAKELGGLPLALITIGRAMYDKKDSSEWEHAIKLLKKARLDDVEFSSKNGSVFHTLKFSFDHLRNETLKQCFLYCSLWPEDHHIFKQYIIEHWIGLGLINEPSVYEMYKVGYSHITRLQAACLLETVDDNYEKIKMHDVIRDMALWIANNQGVETNKWIVQAGTFNKSNEIEVSRDTEKLSLILCRTENIFLSSTCSSTKLSTLLLNYNKLCDSKSLQLEAFSELVVLDLSWNRFEAVPVEICKLVKLQYLNLSFNPFLKSLPEEFKALTNLKYFLLRETFLCTIPNGILSKLKALRMLELRTRQESEKQILRPFTLLEKELQCLPHFQALGISITNMHDFQMLAQTSTVPVRELHIQIFETEEKCLSFTSSFLGNFMLQKNLYSLDLRHINAESVKFERQNHELSICHLERLEIVHFCMMDNLKEVVWMGLDPVDVFLRMQVLHFVYCSQLTSISWVACLSCIRELEVRFCKCMKQLINIDELDNGKIMERQLTFRFLKRMILGSNYALKSISDSMITFPALEILEVYRCNELKKLPFKTDKPPKILKLVGTGKWWNNIEMDDVTHRSSLQNFFKKTPV